MPLSKPLLLAVLALCISAASLLAAEFVVTNTNEIGSGSLAEAITNANNTSGRDSIVFNIPGAGVHKIDLSQAALPRVTDPIVIDGYTQPGAKPNTLAVGNNAVILIQLDGGAIPGRGTNGIELSGGNSVVRGLSITGFSRGADQVSPGGNGLQLRRSGDGNVIEGNFLGIAPDGVTARANRQGVEVGTLQTTIGGIAPEARNVISGNSEAGVFVAWNTTTISGNYIGTDATGTRSIPNRRGILVGGTEPGNVLIGGTAEGAGNLISGNEVGMELGYSSFLGGRSVPHFASGIQVDGNLIGTQSNVRHPLGNGVGILIGGSDNLIGGLQEGAGNTIAFNGSGVVVFGLQSSSTTRPIRAFGNQILSNAIYAHRGLGIDLWTEGVNVNDPQDLDEGPNGLQNAPVITTTEIRNEAVQIEGILNSSPDTQFTIQYFAESVSITHPGQTYLGSTITRTDASGDARFSAVFPLLEVNVTFNATATSERGNTSEFARNPARFLNLSTRLRVESGENAMIAGLIVPARREVVIRALGPSLNVNSVPVAGRLSDPTLEVYDSAGVLLAANDNWRDEPSNASRIEAEGLAPAGDRESAVYLVLPDAGSYTAVMRGNNDSTGIGLVEVYDVSSSGASGVGNISTRGLVEVGDNVMISGFILEQTDGMTRVVARAIGPSLANSGVRNALADPVLELHDSHGTLIASNDNWRTGGQEEDLRAVTLAPRDQSESAIFVAVQPGAYTAILRGKEGSSGVAVLELYNLR